MACLIRFGIHAEEMAVPPNQSPQFIRFAFYEKTQRNNVVFILNI